MVSHNYLYMKFIVHITWNDCSVDVILNSSSTRFCNHGVAGCVTKAWKAHYNYPYLNYKEVPLVVKDRWFNEFKVHFIVLACILHIVQKNITNASLNK